MLSDFTIIRHDFARCEGITIVPIADVHLGAAECMEDEFKEFIKKVAATPNMYLTLGGDLINNGLRGSVGNPFDEKYRPSYQKQLMAEILEPVKDKILCGVGGNHEARSRKDSDTDITLDIFSKLNIEHLYRPSMAFCHISFGLDEKCHRHNIHYCLGVTHGCGGGTLTGSSVNRNERFGMAIDGLDALITGHTHKPVVSNPTKIKIDINHDKVSFAPFKVMTSSSWLNYGGYALNQMLLPANQCAQTMFLNGETKEITISMC